MLEKIDDSALQVAKIYRLGSKILNAKELDKVETKTASEDLRYLPLIDRKLLLHAVVPQRSERLLYCDHIDGDGASLFRLACENDLEGIVAKRKSDPYLLEHARWLKIRNQEYSQWLGREELFERERGSDPDFRVWDGCSLACEELRISYESQSSSEINFQLAALTELVE